MSHLAAAQAVEGEGAADEVRERMKRGIAGIRHFTGATGTWQYGDCAIICPFLTDPMRQAYQ
jgi:hypothetical protein